MMQKWVRGAMAGAMIAIAIPAVAKLSDNGAGSDSHLYKGPVNDAAILDGGYVRNLSEYGLFADIANLKPADNVVPYTLNAALFSDYAVKKRLVYVPNGAGETDVSDIDAVVKLPIGSVLVKTFGYPDAGGDFRAVETRLLLHRKDGWAALPYIWNEDGSDAKLALGGKRLNLTATLPDGTREAISYAVPNKNQCKGCHALDNGLTPIGPKLRNLDDSAVYKQGGGQLARLQKSGVLPSELPKHPIMPTIDSAAPLADKARAYLDINCAHCHNRKGPASNSGLYLTYQERDKVALGIGKRPVAAGRGSGGREFDIAAGHPDKSIMIYRMGSVEPGVAMPELGRNVNDAEGLALIRAWITAMANEQAAD